jgi:7-cyano-7-deazaguanine synthase in queuosine biosynthesis
MDVVLYGRADRPTRGDAGGALKEDLAHSNIQPAPRAWDFLSLALAVTVADLAGHRSKSPDGWTREFDLHVAVADHAFWNSQKTLVEKLLGFLTTDVWNVVFIPGGYAPKPSAKALLLNEDCVSLLSGGLDSFIGNVDLVANGKRPFAVSQTVRGDAENQRTFAHAIGGLKHLQINHNAEAPNPETPSSQRARSLVFLAYGILAATTLKMYRDGKAVTLYVCENGFISINTPLTAMRVGSLSTRTTNPIFLGLIQQLLTNADLSVTLDNPYQIKTKGEMLRECADRKLIKAYACETTSCGRYLQYGYKHCGRCVPCLVRRAAFRTTGIADTTTYVFKELGRDDEDYAGFDDVRSVAMAVAEVKIDGLERWIGSALSTALMADVAAKQAMVGRGLAELGALLKHHGVK